MTIDAKAWLTLKHHRGGARFSSIICRSGLGPGHLSVPPSSGLVRVRPSHLRVTVAALSSRRRICSGKPNRRDAPAGQGIWGGHHVRHHILWPGGASGRQRATPRSRESKFPVQGNDIPCSAPQGGIVISVGKILACYILFQTLAAMSAHWQLRTAQR